MDFYDLCCAYLKDKNDPIIRKLYKRRVPQPKIKGFRISLGFGESFELSLTDKGGVELRDRIRERYKIAMEFFHGPELLDDYREEIMRIVKEIMLNIEHWVYR